MSVEPTAMVPGAMPRSLSAWTIGLGLPVPIAATSCSPFWSICAVHFWIDSVSSPKLLSGNASNC